MTSDEYKKQISNEIKRFIKKRVEVRKIYKELQQVKDNIIYLKKKIWKRNNRRISN